MWTNLHSHPHSISKQNIYRVVHFWVLYVFKLRGKNWVLFFNMIIGKKSGFCGTIVKFESFWVIFTNLNKQMKAMWWHPQCSVQFVKWSVVERLENEARRTMTVLRYTCHFVICIEHFHDPDEANKHTESKIKILSTIYIFSLAGLAE